MATRDLSVQTLAVAMVLARSGEFYLSPEILAVAALPHTISVRETKGLGLIVTAEPRPAREALPGELR